MPTTLDLSRDERLARDTLVGGASRLIPDYFCHLESDACELLGVEVRQVGHEDEALLEIRCIGQKKCIYFHPGSSTILGYEEPLDEASLGDVCDALSEKESFIFNPSMESLVAQVEYFVTDACNLKCSYCYLGPLPAKVKPEDLQPDKFLLQMERLFEEGRFLKSINVAILGGEPLLAFAGIQHVVESLEAMGRTYDTTVNFSLTTNGAMLNDAIASFLIEHAVKVKLSYDGGFQQENRPSKRRPGVDLERILPSLRRIDARFPVTVSATLVPGQLERQAEVYSEIYDLGFRSIQIGVANGVRWSEADLRSYFRGLVALTRRSFQRGCSEIVVEHAYQTIGFGKLRRSHCGADVSHIAFDSLGNRKGCSTSFNGGRHGREAEYGPYDVDEDASCRACAFRYGCAGGCRAFKQKGNPCITDCAPNFLRLLLAILLIAEVPSLMPGA